MSSQIFDVSHSFSETLEKLIFRPGNHEIGNTAKFWRDGKKRIPDSDSATQNCMEASCFVSGQKVELIFFPCVFFFCFNFILFQKCMFKGVKLGGKTVDSYFSIRI